VNLRLTNGDAEAFDLLVNGEVRAAILPRPFGFWAEARGFKRNPDWPDVVDDPMPITIETSARLARDRETELGVFLAAHREAIRYLKSHRVQAIAMLQAQFGHSPSFAARTFEDYFCCMDEDLKVDFKQLEKLLRQIAPDSPGGARRIADDWIAPGALKP